MARTKQTAGRDQGGKALRRIFTKNPSLIKAQRAAKKGKTRYSDQRSGDLGQEQ